MDRGNLQAAVHGVTGLDLFKRLSTARHSILQILKEGKALLIAPLSNQQCIVSFASASLGNLVVLGPLQIRGLNI